MKALRVAAAAVAVLAGLAAVAPAWAHGYYRGGGRGYGYGPSVGFYYGGGPYGWGWPGYYGSGYGYGYPYGYGYVPPAYVYGPPGAVTSTGGGVHRARSAGDVDAARCTRTPTGNRPRALARQPVVVPVHFAARRLSPGTRVPGRMGTRAGRAAGSGALRL